MPVGGCGRGWSEREGNGIEVRFVLPEVLERKQGRRERFLAVATQAKVRVFAIDRGREWPLCEHQVDFKTGHSQFLPDCRRSGRPASVRAEIWEAGWKRKLAEGKARVLKEMLDTQSTVLLKMSLKVPVGEFDP